MSTKITIRPNLNTGPRYDTAPLTTVHRGRLGRKLASVAEITIKCVDTVVRPAGQALAQDKSKKTVHAGFIGFEVDTVAVDPAVHPRVEYAPHKGDTCFHIDGEPYYGGGIITARGHRYYLVG